MAMIAYLSIFFTGLGTLFFIAGMFGLLRFPDVYSRLHALTKADNIGLGLIVIGLSLQTREAGILLKFLLIWLSVIISSAAACYLIARTALRMRIEPWTKS